MASRTAGGAPYGFSLASSFTSSATGTPISAASAASGFTGA